MKKLILTLLGVISCAAAAWAGSNVPSQASSAAIALPAPYAAPARASFALSQDDYEQSRRLQTIWNDRARYFNIAYVFQSLTFTDLNNLKWKSSFGIALSSGKTYYLHKKPLAGMMKFGIDWTMCDLNYAKYNDPSWTNRTPSDGEEVIDLALGLHQADIAMQVGPSFTINPVDQLKIGIYFRYAPTFSMVVLNDELGYNYVSFFNAGISVSYRFISIGFENRWGNASYRNISFSDVNEDAENFGDIFNSFNRKLRTNSMRLYVSLRF